jgi:pyruvate dehydrogenase E2 component (dihydrolipoamide acetyltransferase)
MPIEVQMPKLGLTMEEGTVVEWLKAEGDAVIEGEPLFVLETDKLTLEAEAPASGTLGQILVSAGTTVTTGTAVGLIHPAGEEATPLPANREEATSPREPSKPKATPVARRLAEQAGLDITGIAGTGPGGRVTSGDVERALAQKQEEVAGKPVAVEPQDAPNETRHKVKASPRARRLAEEAGLDLATVEGTGRGGRVMATDVERMLQSAPAQPAIEEAPAPASATPVATPSQVMPLSGMRGVIAHRMAASAGATAAVTTTTQADATELVRLREGLREEWQAVSGLAPSYNDLLLAILAKSLAEFPYMNAHLVGEEIRYIEEINIGLAVDTERGLIVPVIFGVQGMLLEDVIRTTQDLVRRAREDRLLPDDVSGGTFTLSNLGGFDVEASTPIINLPECAILGMGRIAPRPAVFEGELCVRQTVTLSLTYDHRAIDGAPAARFLERVKQLLEQPAVALVR